MTQGPFKRLPLVALEAIDFQIKDPVVRNLEIIFEDIMEQGINTAEKLKPFADLIQEELRKRFKLKRLVFKIEDVDTFDIYSLCGQLTKSSQMFKTYGDSAQKAAEGKLQLSTVDKIDGEVNLKDAIVTGNLCDFEGSIVATRGYVLSKHLTPLEKVSQVMHEVGHIFTYLETLSFTFSTCFILSDTMAKLTKTKSEKERLVIYKDVSKVTGFEVNNLDLVSESEDHQTSMINLFKTIIDSSNSEFGSSIYDQRSWESLSDQFAARMGVAVPLAKATDVFYKLSLTKVKKDSSFKIWLQQILKWVAFITGMFILPVITGIFIFLEVLSLFISPFKDLYDKPRERIDRLKNEIVAQMKLYRGNDEIEKQLQEDLKVVQSILDRVEDNEDYVEKVWLFFSSSSRDQKQRRILLQDLQALTNNDLFAAANLLNTLKGK